MLDQDNIKNLFEEKYEDRLGMAYDDWMEQGPQTEDAAYARLEVIDEELKNTEDQYQDAEGEEKTELNEYRERLRNEYQFIEEIFGLESKDE